MSAQTPMVEADSSTEGASSAMQRVLDGAASIRLPDLSPWWTFLMTAPIMGLQMWALTIGRPFHDRYFYTEFSVIEITTTLASLLAAICLFGAAKRASFFPARAMRWALVLLAIGAIYFCGEEASWGQHYFGWSTPESWKQANYQGETNLHNIDEFRILDSLPRNLLSAGIIVSCVFWPLWKWARRIDLDAARSRFYWIWPTSAVWPVGWLSLLPQLDKRLGWGLLFDQGETEEMYFALFLAVYAVSLLIRLAAARKIGSLPDGPDRA